MLMIAESWAEKHPMELSNAVENRESKILLHWVVGSQCPPSKTVVQIDLVGPTSLAIHRNAVDKDKSIELMGIQETQKRKFEHITVARSTTRSGENLPEDGLSPPLVGGLAAIL
jgi:hypothetical protein